MNIQTSAAAMSIPKGAIAPPTPNQIALALNTQSVTICWLAGDGSDRSYYRVLDAENNSFVLMQLSGDDAASLNEGKYEWITIQKLLACHNIKTPALVKACPEFNAIIIEDYGNTMLESSLRNLHGDFGAQEQLFFQAFDIIHQMLCLPMDLNSVWTSRAFDEERLYWELDFFKKHLIENTLQISLSPSQQIAFKEDAKRLSKILAPDSKYFCHRDFHSRNLMVTSEKKLAVIDFQDARLGSPNYDLVSLCFDSYVDLSQKQRTHLMNSAIKKLARKNSGDFDFSQRSWKPCLLQRQLKALGSFGYLTNVKNKPQFLNYLTPALNTIGEGYCEDARFPFLSGELLNIIEQHLKIFLTK